jgi:hypothetical protein
MVESRRLAHSELSADLGLRTIVRKTQESALSPRGSRLSADDKSVFERIAGVNDKLMDSRQVSFAD